MSEKKLKNCDQSIKSVTSEKKMKNGHENNEVVNKKFVAIDKTPHWEPQIVILLKVPEILKTYIKKPHVKIKSKDLDHKITWSAKPLPRYLKNPPLTLTVKKCT